MFSSAIVCGRMMTYIAKVYVILGFLEQHEQKQLEDSLELKNSSVSKRINQKEETFYVSLPYSKYLCFTFIPMEFHMFP